MAQSKVSRYETPIPFRPDPFEEIRNRDVTRAQLILVGRKTGDTLKGDMQQPIFATDVGRRQNRRLDDRSERSGLRGPGTL